MRVWPRARARPQPTLRPGPCALPPPCATAATPAAHLGGCRITSLNLSYFFVQVPLPLLMGLPCPRSEENYARRGIAVGAAVAAATARGVGSSRVEPGPASRLSLQLRGLIGKLLPKLMINAYASRCVASSSSSATASPPARPLCAAAPVRPCCNTSRTLGGV
jgi:hypothetical protein